MGVGVEEFLAVEEGAGGLQGVADGVSGFVDVDACEEGNGGVVRAIALDCIGDSNAIFPTQEEIFFSMRRCHMDKARSSICCNKVTT
jgi:hypothetical protein